MDSGQKKTFIFLFKKLNFDCFLYDNQGIKKRSEAQLFFQPQTPSFAGQKWYILLHKSSSKLFQFTRLDDLGKHNTPSTVVK